MTITSETALSISTISANLSFWYCHFTYHNYTNVKKIIEHRLVTGLKLDSHAKPDPICEPYITRKMLSNFFLFSLNHNCSLIYLDLHGLLPIATHQGYKYWITFINDATHIWTI